MLTTTHKTRKDTNTRQLHTNEIFEPSSADGNYHRNTETIKLIVCISLHPARKANDLTCLLISGFSRLMCQNVSVRFGDTVTISSEDRILRVGFAHSEERRRGRDGGEICRTERQRSERCVRKFFFSWNM